MSCEFGDKLASLGCHGKFPSNIERDLMRYMNKAFGLDFTLDYVRCLVRDKNSVSAEADIGVLLPHEVAHWLWRFNRQKFESLFSVSRLHRFWCKTIERNEPWFQRHPLRELIVSSADKSKFLPIHFFGDDGTLRKTRVMATMTWFPGLETPLSALHSRIPCYVLPRHILLPDMTESAVQERIVWAMDIWATGRFSYLDSKQVEWKSGSVRSKLAGQPICGGYIGVYVNTTADQQWILQHFRHEENYNKVDMCTWCCAQNCAGPLNFTRGCAFPPRTHEAYMASAAARRSPLTKMCGFYWTMTRPEAMHIGPLGALPPAIGSALVELCEEGRFGCGDLSPWDFRITAQLSEANRHFQAWAKRTKQQHTVKSFTRCGVSMYTANTSFPSFKGKAHNALVVARWLEHVCAEVAHVSEYATLRARVIWGWTEMYEVSGNTEDNDFMSAAELARLDTATKLILHGTSALGRANFDAHKARWKTLPKLHQVWHLNAEAQASHRPPRAFWSFKDEEMMGCLSRIACAVHACSISSRSLQRWLMQFFSAMSEPDP